MRTSTWSHGSRPAGATALASTQKTFRVLFWRRLARVVPWPVLWVLEVEWSAPKWTDGGAEVICRGIGKPRLADSIEAWLFVTQSLWAKLGRIRAALGR